MVWDAGCGLQNQFALHKKDIDGCNYKQENILLKVTTQGKLMILLPFLPNELHKVYSSIIVSVVRKILHTHTCKFEFTPAWTSYIILI